MTTTTLVRGFKMTRTARLLVLTTAVLIVVLAEPAFAAVTVTRAEVSGSGLRIEGTAIAARSITVDGIVMGTSDSSGSFRIQRDPFTRPADCTVDVKDGSTMVTVARLSGCTVTSTPPTPGDTIAPTVPGNLTASLAGTTANLGWTASADAVGVTGYRVSRNGTGLTGTVVGTTFANSGLAAGTYSYTVTAMDAAGNVSGASNSASVTVASAPPPPGDTTAPSVPVLTVALVGTTANLSWTTSTDNVGVTGYTINRNGVFHTTALNPFYNGTNLAPGTYTYAVTAADAAGNVSAASNSVSVTVLAPPATDVTAPSVPTGLVATVVGSTIGLSWNSSADNTAVTGYRLTRNGVVRATTTIDTTFQDLGLAAGTYTYTVVAFDGAGNTSAASTSVVATVGAPEALGFITPSRLPAATVGQAYLGYIVSTDPPGVSSFRFKLVSGRVPAGTSFVGNNLPTRPEARVIGTPTTVGTSTFTVEVSDGTGATARRTFSISVLAAPALAIAGGVNVLLAGTVGQPYGSVLSATGGVRPYTWAITFGTLPPGITLVGDAFFGTPTTAGTYSFTARVTDSRGATASGQFAIAVGR